MSDRVEPMLALTVEAKGWCGDDEGFSSRSGSPAEVHMDPEVERKVVELLRETLAERLEELLTIAFLRIGETDFTNPALPTRRELEGIVGLLDQMSETAAALREMSPTEFDDDEGDDGGPEPAPIEGQGCQVSRAGEGLQR